ncbi:DDT4L protein, partial [Atractosteus spatula]|nr:DDT4L protein [Atractosteus spatula]
MVYSQALGFAHGMGVLSEEDNLVEAMKKFVNQFTSARKEKCADKPFDSGCSSEGEMSEDSGVDRRSPEEPLDERLWQELAQQMELCLARAKKTELQCQEVLIPRQLAGRIARDALRTASDEPCGLRGAVIQVHLETGSAVRALGSIVPDRSVTPTFELSVVFKADQDNWPSLRHLFGKVLKLSPGFRLVKRKLYSSAGPVIQEF